MFAKNDKRTFGRYDNPQSVGARFLLILTAWITGPWAAASLTGKWWVAIPVAIALVAIPLVFSTTGNTRFTVIPTPGLGRLGIELMLFAVAVGATRVVFPKWSWQAVLALVLAVAITNYPRMRWLAKGTPAD